MTETPSQLSSPPLGAANDIPLDLVDAPETKGFLWMRYDADAVLRYLNASYDAPAWIDTGNLQTGYNLRGPNGSLRTINHRCAAHGL